MKRGYLSQYFKGIAVKKLSAVEAEPATSNQHEFNGVSKLAILLGPAIPRQRFNATFIYLSDDDPEPIKETGSVTWYDAREKNPSRSEKRLYFPSTSVSENSSEGDLLLLARKPDDSILVIIAEAGSTIERQLLWLMGESDDVHPGFSVKGEIENDQVKLDFISQLILEQVGIDAIEKDENCLEELLRRFDGKLPQTAQLSQFARDSLDLNPRDDPDGVLLAWYQKEYILFRTLEAYLVEPEIKKGFGCIDNFMALSLSVSNRRKSRAGNALQNHLLPIFIAYNLKFSSQAVTENGHKPDFLFPGIDEYNNPVFPTGNLLMLGAKTSCKDRWRQVLTEAAKIPQKHLFTLETSISEKQTEQMRSHNLRLVVPQQYHATFSSSQQDWLLNLKEFIELVQLRQR